MQNISYNVQLFNQLVKLMLSNTTYDQKILITKDVLHKYVKLPNFWLVLDNKDKPKGLFNSFLEAYHKGHKNILILGKDEILTKKSKATIVNAKCHCGNMFIARQSDIKRGHTKSCGCLKRHKNML
jgi:hypothetical protein